MPCRPSYLFTHLLRQYLSLSDSSRMALVKIMNLASLLLQLHVCNNRKTRQVWISWKQCCVTHMGGGRRMAGCGTGSHQLYQAIASYSCHYRPHHKHIHQIIYWIALANGCTTLKTILHQRTTLLSKTRSTNVSLLYGAYMLLFLCTAGADANSHFRHPYKSTIRFI